MFLRALCLALVSLVVSVQALLRCQGHHDGMPPEVPQPVVHRRLRSVLYNINSSFVYSTGVSFTRALKLPAPHNDTSVTVRLLYWDQDVCMPTGRGSINGTVLDSSFRALYHASAAPGHFGWGTTVNGSYLLDYYTSSPSHHHSISFESKDRVSLYCTEEAPPSCSPRTSNLISGTNGVFNVLRGGESLRSPNGKYRFVVEERCNMVLYDSFNRALWQSNTTAWLTLCYLELRPDLNLVLISKLGGKVWESYPESKLVDQPEIVSHPATGVLSMQNDGNLVLYATDRVVVPIWATNTYR